MARTILNPYKKTEQWHRIMMESYYRCVMDGCNHRHAVAVENGKAVCVYHEERFTGVIKKSAW